MSTTKLQTLDTKQYPAVKATWERSDMPETPRSLPCSVLMNVGAALEIYAEPIEPSELDGFVLRDYQPEMRLVFDAAHVVGADIYVMPDIPDDADWQWIGEADMSIAELRLKDPFDVLPYFTCVFTAGKSYWFKLLTKLLREKMGVDVKLTEEDRDKRKRRLISANVAK
jgi:hypothetical protein